MLNFNAEFQNGTSKITQIRLSVLLQSGTLLSLDETNIMLGGFTRDSSTSIDGEFTIGAAVTGKMTAVIDNSTNDFSGYDFRGATITARLGGQLSDGTYQLLQVGIYTVDEYKYDGSNITLTAYDNMQKFDVDCTSTTVSFPITLSALISTACTACGVTLANSSLPNGSLSIPSKPLQWDTMTWHDVISSYAQMACCFAKILPDGRLYFSWYNTSQIQGTMLDGGTYVTTTTPYSDGDDADGGDFTYTESTSYDGGHFGDRESTHIISQMYDLTVDTDDVYISGIKVILSASDNVNATDGTADYTKLLGTTDYLIIVENNPLIETTALADTICTYLYNYIVGMRFRPLSVSCIENPALEAGDTAIIADKDKNTYNCFLSRVTYTSNSATIATCDAASPKQSLRSRYTEEQKTKALARRTFDQAITDAEAAMSTIMTALATTMGLYQYTQTQSDGSTIYVYGNKNTLVSSNIRWKFSAGAVMVSSDYGATWNGAISSDGIAVLQEVYAVKVNADYIKTGTMVGASIKLGGSGNGNGKMYVYDADGTLCGEIDNTGVTTLGTYYSYSTTYNHVSSLGSGRLFFFDNVNSYSSLKNLKWSDACGTLGPSANDNYYGMAILSPKDYIAFGKQTKESAGAFYLIINNSSKIDSVTERIYIKNSSVRMNSGNFNITSGSINLTSGNVNLTLGGITLTCGDVILNKGAVSLKNPSASTMYPVRFRSYDDDTAYAYVGYSYPNDVIKIGGNNLVNNIGLYVHGSLTVAGTKNRAVETEHYGTVGMNAFETASSHFADVGSGTIGEDGTVTIFFDPVFAETIDMKAEYQVLITRTSEKQTEWVDKQNGYFIAHGESGATFDWMIIGYQRDYVTNRLENIGKAAEAVNDDPIYKEDTSAIDAVEEMVSQYNSELEDLENG